MAQQSLRLSMLRAKPDVDPIPAQRAVYSWLEKPLFWDFGFCTTVFTVKSDTWNKEGMLEP